jgi:chitin disaccharide deacetylase
VKRLIVNADDFGADAGRNAGIAEAIEAGIVTSVSLLANGPAFADAVAHLRSRAASNVSVGLHLNLSEGRPLAGALRRIVGADGSFIGKGPACERFERSGDPDLVAEIEAETIAQLEALRAAGLRTSHFDGHQHVHVCPAVAAVAAAAARKHGISWVRIPAEPIARYAGATLDADCVERARCVSSLAEKARPVFLAAGLRATDGFAGLLLRGCVSAERLAAAVRSLPEGVTELMIHPGRVLGGEQSGPFSAFSTAERECELDALLDPRFRAALAEAGVTLTSFAELHAACGS